MYLLLCLSQKLHAQLEVSKYPIRFSQYFNCLSIENPAAAGASSKLEISSGNQKLLGNYSKVSTYYLDANTQLGQRKPTSRKPFSAIGILFYNDKEGRYINRSRFYATYVWHAYLTPNIKISGGLRFGGMNYAVKGTALSGNGSDFAPDGSVGLRFYNNKFHLGMALNQIFDSEIQPLEERTKLNSYLSLTGGLEGLGSSVIQIEPLYSVRVPLNSDNILVDATLLLTYKKKLSCALGIHNNNKMVNSIGIKDILNSGNKLDVNLTYCYPITSTGVNTSFYELGVRFMH